MLQMAPNRPINAAAALPYIIVVVVFGFHQDFCASDIDN